MKHQLEKDMSDKQIQKFDQLIGGVLSRTALKSQQNSRSGLNKVVTWHDIGHKINDQEEIPNECV